MRRLDVSHLTRRDTRAGLWSYTEDSTDVFPNGRYTNVGTYWVSFLPAGAREGTVGDVADSSADAHFGFHDQVTVNVNMVITCAGRAYRVTGIPEPRTFVPHAVRVVSAVFADKDVVLGSGGATPVTA